MPITMPNRVEYEIVNGRVGIVSDDGNTIPAYWSHPKLGGRFPAICIIHDWWGITTVERRLAHLFAQWGCYAVVPDLFGGATATTPHEAMALVRQYSDHAFPLIDRALKALEMHNKTNAHVGVIGIGMGGSFAYEAAINRPMLEAVVSIFGLPGRYLGKFKTATVPILALYGQPEPIIKPDDMARLQAEFSESAQPHTLALVPGLTREMFAQAGSTTETTPSDIAWGKIITFLDDAVLSHSEAKPDRPAKKKKP